LLVGVEDQLLPQLFAFVDVDERLVLRVVRKQFVSIVNAPVRTSGMRYLRRRAESSRSTSMLTH
jgi:hypothetical protein